MAVNSSALWGMPTTKSSENSQKQKMHQDLIYRSQKFIFEELQWNSNEDPTQTLQKPQQKQIATHLSFLQLEEYLEQLL